TKVVIDHGAVPPFVVLLSSPYYDVRDQAVWALGNIAADSSQHRDLVLLHGALDSLVRHLEAFIDLIIRRGPFPLLLPKSEEHGLFETILIFSFYDVF
ncbi:importin subunit alpha-1-like, partial [Trifolium medium]|nr:importin subunit alpha-1-like [Trifolium medium]